MIQLVGKVTGPSHPQRDLTLSERRCSHFGKCHSNNSTLNVLKYVIIELMPKNISKITTAVLERAICFIICPPLVPLPNWINTRFIQRIYLYRLLIKSFIF